MTSARSLPQTSRRANARSVELGRREDHELVRRLSPWLMAEGWATLAVIYDDPLHQEAGGPGFVVARAEEAYRRFAIWAQRARLRRERVAVILRGAGVAPRLVRVAGSVGASR